MTSLADARNRGLGWPLNVSHPGFAPIQAQLRALNAYADWPSVGELDQALAAWLRPHGLSLMEQAPARGPRNVASMYEVAADRGTVPTRARNLHDLLNAVTWARFPLAKRQLTGHLANLQRARLRADGSLPNARSAGHDRLAMLDEGGALVSEHGQPRGWLFGHALYEHLCLGRPLPRAAVVRIPQGLRPADFDPWLAHALSTGAPVDPGPGLDLDDTYFT